MLHHIVMWKIKATADGSSREANIAKAKALLDACANLVPGIVRFEVAGFLEGMECTYDLVLNSSFTSREAAGRVPESPFTHRPQAVHAPGRPGTTVHGLRDMMLHALRVTRRRGEENVQIDITH